MAQRSNGARSRAPQQRRAPGGEIDRYHYVDRDIYSHSDHRVSQPSRKKVPKRKRKKKSAGKAFLAVVLVLAAVCGLLYVGFTFAMGRLDRPEIDTSQYEEQPSAAPAWSVLEDSSVINILLIGKDKGDDGLSSRSDTSMLVSIDTKKSSSSSSRPSCAICISKSRPSDSPA